MQLNEENNQTNRNQERQDRLAKLKILKDQKINPYPASTKKKKAVSLVLEKFETLLKGGKNVVLAGRLMSKRSHGNLTFCNIQDGSGRMQVALSKNEIGSDKYKQFVKLIDVGDFVELTGVCFVTHKQENSLMVRKWKLLSKALRPLPDKWHGIKDEEDRFRKRYLDLLMNKDRRDLFIKKSLFWDVVRGFMKKNGFLEVETPTLETTTGGAEAAPFKTTHNDFGIDVFLRISIGELWQKRLMAAGFEKTFEIGKAYRNEGSSPDHIQEFTNMEFYWAYADFKDGMKLSKKMYMEIADKVFNTTKFVAKGMTFDLSDEWREIDYKQEVLDQTGIDVEISTKEEMATKLEELGVKYDGENKERLTDSLWKFCRKNIAGPAFLINHPKIISPLAKSLDKQPNLTQRFQIIIAGTEIGNGYSELNDPLEQQRRFEEQKKLIEAGDEEAMMPDYEFVEMLEYGMPPTCGFGFGERLFTVLVDKPIRETTMFPLLRPKLGGEEIKALPTPKILVKATDVDIAIPTPRELVEKIDMDLGLDYKKALNVLEEYIVDENTYKHSIETEAIMRVVAKKLEQDEEKWGIVGLLHDIDWDKTKEDKRNHTVLAGNILIGAGGSEFLVNSIQSHCYGNTECGNYGDKSRSTILEHSLIAAETITGLIVASALMQPDKKLASVKLKSLKKKFKNKSFAANCNRELIREIEKTGLSLDDFFEISLDALKNISDKLGL